jgi:hypothetical protein
MKSGKTLPNISSCVKPLEPNLGCFPFRVAALIFQVLPLAAAALQAVIAITAAIISPVNY